MLSSHFTLLAPAMPGVMIRMGKPWEGGRGKEFMVSARRMLEGALRARDKGMLEP